MPKVRIVGIPKNKVNKFVLGGPDDVTTTTTWTPLIFPGITNETTQAPLFNWMGTDTTTTIKMVYPPYSPEYAGPLDPNAVAAYVPPTTSTTTLTVESQKCPKGYREDKDGKCVPARKAIHLANDIIQEGLVFGNLLATIHNNKESKEWGEQNRRNSLFTGMTQTPGREDTMGNQTVNGYQFPASMTPPNEGQYQNAFYGKKQQFGGAFMSDGAQPSKLRIKIVEAPDDDLSTMKYGGQSNYGFDSGWKRSYTEMNKTASDNYTNSMSEDTSTDEEPVLEAEGGETIFKPGDQTLHNLNGPRHTNGGIPLTKDQVESKNRPDLSSFIYSDTAKLKIKDKDILDHFGITYEKGGVTPAKISKKYDLNKWQAILNDPDADPISRSTAQLMLDKNVPRLAELAAIQERMKGLQPPAFAQEILGGGGKQQQATGKYGGPFKFGRGGSTDPEDEWIKKILEYESTKGAADGTGLSNYGIKKSKTKKEYPDMWKDGKITEKEAIDFIKSKYLPKVKDYPQDVQKRLVDYMYNTGRSMEDLLLYANGNITLDDINSSNVYTPQWTASKADIEKKLSDPTFLKKLDEAKLNVYKTTKQVNGNPNPAYTATWEPRVNMWNTTTATASAPNTVVSGSGVPAVPAVGASSAPITSTPSKSNLGLGEWSDDYETLEKTLKDDRNKELRAELYNRFKKANPKSKVTEDQYIDNLLTAQKHNFAITNAHVNDPNFLTDESWDWGNTKTKKHSAGWKNKRYNEEVTKLGMTPLKSEGIQQFQQAYRDLEDLMHDRKFFETFGKYFATNPTGKPDQTYRGKPISPVDDYYGNTTRGQMLRLSGWTDTTTTVQVFITTTRPPDTVKPKYICLPDGKGGGKVVESSGSGYGYDTAEEAAKHCGERPKKPPYGMLLPDKINMLAHAAFAPEMILPFNPDLAFSPRHLNLEYWDAPAAAAFATQYAAPASELNVYGPTQGQTANKAFLSGQAAQTITGQIMPGVIGRNVDRVNAFSGEEAKRQDTVDAYNNMQKQKRWEGWATARQQNINAWRQYLKENSDAFTRAWDNMQNWGDINDTNTSFYKDINTGRQVFYNPNFNGTSTASSDDASDLGSKYNSYFKAYYNQINDPNISETERKKRAGDLAMAAIQSTKFTQTSDPYSNKYRVKTSGYDGND